MRKEIPTAARDGVFFILQPEVENSGLFEAIINRKK
jgi:hypothetical protein